MPGCCLAPLLAAAGAWTGTVTVAGLWRGAAAALLAAGGVARVLASSVPVVRHRRRHQVDRMREGTAAMTVDITGHGGVFTVRVDGEQIYDKTQAFDLDRIITAIQTRL